MNLFSDISFANIFSISLAYLFIPLTVFFCGAKIVNFNEVQLVDSFMVCAFGVIFKQSQPYPRTFRFYPILSSRRFTLLHFIILDMPYFELIFMKSVRSVLRYCFKVDVQLFQHYSLKRLSLFHLSHLTAISPISKII